MRRLAVVLLVAVGLLASSVTSAATEKLVIGYLQLEKDPRYARKRVYARFLGQAQGRPYVGAKVALKEVKFHGAAAGVAFTLERRKATDTAGLLDAVDELSTEGVRFFILDAPGDVVAKLSAATTERDVLLLNVSARDDSLRGEQCQAHLLHVIPSHAMLADALAQYLVSRKWTKVLSLVGPKSDDQAIAASFERSAKRLGLRITERRDFVLGNDPRQRQRNNVALLTAGADYDVLFVADSDGEFAREVPYQTVRPQLVVGSEGLAALAWHWAWERHGAPQLEGRFEKAAKRPMQDIDWAAWIAVKAVASAVQRSASADFDTVRAYLLGPDLILDGFKGNRLNFRSWDNQLRQPILLGTHNWVVARAPIEGFLHQTNKLDTLGFDERESRCNLKT